MDANYFSKDANLKFFDFLKIYRREPIQDPVLSNLIRSFFKENILYDGPLMLCNFSWDVLFLSPKFNEYHRSLQNSNMAFRRYIEEYANVVWDKKLNEINEKIATVENEILTLDKQLSVAKAMRAECRKSSQSVFTYNGDIHRQSYRRINEVLVAIEDQIYKNRLIHNKIYFAPDDKIFTHSSDDYNKNSDNIHYLDA